MSRIAIEGPGRPAAMLAALALAAALAAPARAQQAPPADPLAAARTLYASARYEAALELLDRVRQDPTAGRVDAVDVDKYRALCLLALGRETEAESAFAGVVAVDPMYLPDTREVAPSVRAFFRDVRRRMLPAIARTRYTEAKADYDHGEYRKAADAFRRVVAILNDPDMEPGHDDLRQLADGFRELAEAKAPPAPAAPPPAPAAPAPAEPAPPPAPAPVVYDQQSPGIVPPVVLVQSVPSPPPEARLTGHATGAYEVTIDEHGRVESVLVRSSIQPAYDREFIDATALWRYQPALLGGQPVKFKRVIEVSVR
jgi:Gram-negative bacterial TonB protein C-terminal